MMPKLPAMWTQTKEPSSDLEAMLDDTIESSELEVIDYFDYFAILSKIFPSS